MTTQNSKIEITKSQIKSSNTNPPENTDGFLFLEAPDINSLLFFGGTSQNNFGLYLYDILNSSWSKPELKGDIPPPMSHFAGWYDTPYLFIHGGKSLTENKSLKETYLIDIEALIAYKIFTIEEPSSRYGHMAVKNNDKQAYIFGGCNIGKKSERFLSDLHKMEYKNISVIAGDNNTNINGASWIVNIQTKGDKPAGRKGYSMLFIESLNNLLIYGGELKDNKINDESAYLYNIDEKEYKKIFFKDENKNNLISRAYHTMHLNDTNNNIYIIGGINSNKEILDDIIEINLNGKEVDNKYNKYKANEIFNKRYEHKGCNIFIGENDDDLMYHIIILGGKKNDKEFYDLSLIDFYIQGNNNSKNKTKIKEVNTSSEIKNDSINENDIDIQIEPTSIVKYNNENNELKAKRKEYVETLNNLQKDYIDLYLKNQKISSEYYQNLSKLNELKNKELFETVIKNISFEKKRKEINIRKEKINQELDEYNRKLKENLKFNELLNEYMNVYKERFCVLSDFLYGYIEDIMKADKFIVENCSNSIDINFDSFANKRKSYRSLIANLLQDIKKYGTFENDLYDNLVKMRDNYSQQSESSSIRNTIQKVVKKEKKFENEFDK